MTGWLEVRDLDGELLWQALVECQEGGDIEAVGEDVMTLPWGTMLGSVVIVAPDGRTFPLDMPRLLVSEISVRYGCVMAVEC